MANKFSEKFASYIILSLIDFFSDYNQIEPDKSLRDLTVFMTPLGLMQITILVQGAINLIAQFVRIVFKILVPYLHDWAKLFLDDIKMKEPKTTYNNEELASRIWQYVVEYIQNPDKVLLDLKQARVTISKAKSQFR